MAIVAVVLFVIGIVLKLINQRPDLIIWFILFGGLLVSIDVALMLHRGHYYRRVS
jgi:hypothetical protein